MRKKQRWLTRKRGTPRQIGKLFKIEEGQKYRPRRMISVALKHGRIFNIVVDDRSAEVEASGYVSACGKVSTVMARHVSIRRIK